MNQLSFHSLKSILPKFAEHEKKECFLKMLILWNTLRYGDSSENARKEDEENAYVKEQS